MDLKSFFQCTDPLSAIYSHLIGLTPRVDPVSVLSILVQAAEDHAKRSTSDVEKRILRQAIRIWWAKQVVPTARTTSDLLRGSGMMQRFVDAMELWEIFSGLNPSMNLAVWVERRHAVGWSRCDVYVALNNFRNDNAMVNQVPEIYYWLDEYWASEKSALIARGLKEHTRVASNIWDMGS